VIRPEDSGRRSGVPYREEQRPVFDMRVERNDSLTYVELVGEFDLSCEETFEEVVGAVRSGRLVLDLRDLTFIDSAGLRKLLRTWQRSDQDGFALEIVGVNDQVLKTLQMTGLDEVLPMADQTSLKGDRPNSNGSGSLRPPSAA
jgi:anti-sigma B factor antagonist